jgi:hypothetical protein
MRWHTGDLLLGIDDVAWYLAAIVDMKLLLASTTERLACLQKERLRALP